MRAEQIQHCVILPHCMACSACTVWLRRRAMSGPTAVAPPVTSCMRREQAPHGRKTHNPCSPARLAASSRCRSLLTSGHTLRQNNDLTCPLSHSGPRVRGRAAASAEHSSAFFSPPLPNDKSAACSPLPVRQAQPWRRAAHGGPATAPAAGRRPRGAAPEPRHRPGARP